MYVPLLIFAGGGTGALLRWSIEFVVPGWRGVVFANIVGSFVLAVIAASPLREHAPSMAFFGTGLLGGFTTYSTFNLNLLEAAHRGAWGEAALQLGLTVVACVLSGLAGLWVGSMIPR